VRPAAPGGRAAPQFAPGGGSRISFHGWPWQRRGGTQLPQSHQRSDPVAAVCDICGKRPGFGNRVSHSHRRTPRRWNPNIQVVRATVDGTPKRLHVCTSCIKAGKVTR
jgi:large subunit ribosomal protein L28